MIKVIVIGLSVITGFSLYCCLVIGKRFDEGMQKCFPTGKEIDSQKGR